MTSDTAKFERAAKRLQKLVAEVAAGSGDEKRTIRAIDRLWNALGAPEIQCRDDRDAYYDRVSAIVATFATACESGRLVRIATREAEIAKLRQAERSARPARGTYEHEFALMRAGL